MTCTRIFLGILGGAAPVTPALAAQAAPGCEEWNTQEFFRKASVADISECIDGG